MFMHFSDNIGKYANGLQFAPVSFVNKKVKVHNS
jgi:hypothetical protein